MQIPPSMTMIPLLAMILASSVVQAIGEPSADARAAAAAAARSWRIDLAQIEAPIGHRQPTLQDLPPWLREQEKPGAEATQAPQAGVQTSSKRTSVTNSDARRGQDLMTACPEFATLADSGHTAAPRSVWSHAVTLSQL